MKADFSFVRAGRGLGEWLPLLLSEVREERVEAAEAVGGMWKGLRSYSTDVRGVEGWTLGAGGMKVHAERFTGAVREAVDAAGFPRALFVRKLMLYRMAQHRDWLMRAGKMSDHDETYDRRETELIERSLCAADEGERTRAAKQFARLFCASLARDQRISSGAEGLQPPGMVSYLVFGALGEALLEAGDVLKEMLEDRGTEHYAIEALGRVGRKGIGFVPALLGKLDEVREKEYGFQGAHALAAVGRGDAGVVEELVERLRGGHEGVRNGAAEVLELMGTDVAGRAGDIVELLHGMVAGSGHPVVVQALASVGREREDVMREVVERAKVRPARMKKAKVGKWEQEYDEVMWERGVAIEGMKYFTKFPEVVVPVLADAVETFAEYDPDWEHERAEHGRVMASLAAFGENAVAAVPVLVRHVRRVEDGAVDLEVVRVLGDIGAGAREALGVLEEVEREMREEDGVVGVEDVPTREFDPVGWAIGRIKGEITG